MTIWSSPAANRALWEGDVVEEDALDGMCPSVRGHTSAVHSDPSVSGVVGRSSGSGSSKVTQEGKQGRDPPSSRFQNLFRKRTRQQESTAMSSLLEDDRNSDDAVANDDDSVRTTRHQIDGNPLLTRQKAVVFDRPSASRGYLSPASNNAPLYRELFPTISDLTEGDRDYELQDWRDHGDPFEPLSPKRDEEDKIVPTVCCFGPTDHDNGSVPDIRSMGSNLTDEMTIHSDAVVEPWMKNELATGVS